ncbi:MAG: hypothetical protein CVT92_00835 [Bacteroidetes bacterium HGW-Bacteroidetes-1]|jgi:L-fucose isomerase-like protein|nr:MAG: hypothetical protein CVT92_00835 [Bacteroidetes bacterium HGW-Bacteroidetes-1]
MQEVIRLKFLAFTEAPDEVITEAEMKLISLNPDLKFERVEENADGVYFVSGGSENFARESLLPSEINILIAGKENNAWAAATEVKAWASQHDLQSVLISADEPNFVVHLHQYVMIKQSYTRLKGQRLGLIGEVSDWLIASSFTPELVMQKFGLELLQYSYGDLPDYLSFPDDKEFSAMFPSLQSQQKELTSISSFLKNTIAVNHLDGLTIQCFRMVRERGVTACLPVGMLNSKGLPVGCEGDLVSIFSIMLMKELIGQIAWMANLVSLNEESILLAHCTAPLKPSTLYQIKTHYETDISSAICAKLEMDVVTIFRINNSLDQAFVAEGFVIDRPEYPWACRTQLEVSISHEDICKLNEKPLGNHHLVLMGRHAAYIRRALQVKQVAFV